MKQKLFYLLIFSLFLASCEKDENVEAPDISGIETTDYTLNIGDKVTLAPNIKNLKGNTYSWLLDGKEVDTGTSYTFTATEPGEFTIVFQATNKGGVDKEAFKVKVERLIILSFEKEMFTVSKCKVLQIVPSITGPNRDDYTYEWTINNSVVGKNKDFDFISTAADTTFTLKFTASAGKQKQSAMCKVKVENAEYSKYATTFVDFMYAPKGGWFLPEEEGSKRTIYSREEYKQKVTERIQSANPYEEFLRLGNWGSYIVLGFDHTIENQLGKSDIKLYIRDYSEAKNTFFVAYDKNKNGQPDEDEWYEIKMPYLNMEHIENYKKTVTYKGTEGVTNENKIKYKWTDSNNASGEEETYYAAFPGCYKNEEGEILFTKEKGWFQSYTLEGRQMTVRVQRAYTPRKTFNINIGDAIDKNGKSVHLPGADFIKVQNISVVYWQNDAEPMDYSGQKLTIVHDKHLK